MPILDEGERALHLAGMSDEPQPGSKPQPHRTAATERAAEKREARSAAALRSNLRRRKTQGRERDETAPEPPADTPKS
jgi:hypothetical protein